MKEIYLDIMDQVVGAYSDEDVRVYLAQTETHGLQEHGFPRLTACLGILQAHGRKTHLYDEFIRMMDLCCEQIPTAYAKCKNVGNDFSVKEIVLALLALEKAEAVPAEKIAHWRACLAQIDPYTCYTIIANPKEAKTVGNWAAYNAASEQLRKFAGIGDASGFIEDEIASQVREFDESGLYKEPGCPTLYDLAARAQLMACNWFGYQGRYRDVLEENFQKSGLPTLYMQSVTGEIPFGGRSNQYIFNEAYLACVLEYEATRYGKMGDLQQAGIFKGAAKLAADAVLNMLADGNLRHVKNFFPKDSLYGCEGYGYFNKYMVSTASFIYLAYIFADESIEPLMPPAGTGGYVYESTPAFHKVVANNGTYFVQYDLNADVRYDAGGLGRVHRKGAPSALCLSLPFSKGKAYHTDLDRTQTLSIACGLEKDGCLAYACDPGVLSTVQAKRVDGTDVLLTLSHALPNCAVAEETCRVTDAGVFLTAQGAGKVFYRVPIFHFDGETYTKIRVAPREILVRYKGFRCVYRTKGFFADCGTIFANRNGHYQLFEVQGEGDVELQIIIEEDNVCVD